MNFRLWARVRCAGPRRFFVTISAASEDDPDRTGGVETGEATGLEEALPLRDRLISQLGDRICARGHSVIEVRLD